LTLLHSLRRFAQDKRAIELDYSLSLFIFIISLAFTFLILTQYLDLKHSEVGDVNRRLDCLRVMDELTGSPGWMGGRSDWEALVPSLDLVEKVNDQSFFLGLRENDRFHAGNIVIPGASDVLLQTASGPAIASAAQALKAQGVMCLRLPDSFIPILVIDTSKKNSSIVVVSAADNATAHVGSFYAGSDLQVSVTDTRADGLVLYDTAGIGNNTVKEDSVFAIGGRNFTVHAIDQERVLVSCAIPEGYVIPGLDQYFEGLARSQLEAAGIRFHFYQDLLSGGSGSLEYTLFSREYGKFEGQIIGLSIGKIRALGDYVPYEVARACLGINGEFHVRIIRKRDGAVVLDYGSLPPADTVTSEREVDVESVPCTMEVQLW